MARIRIRSLKPEFWVDEKLGPATDTVRLVFLGLISMADDFGRLVDSEKQVEAFIWPYENRTADLRESLANLSRMGRIRRGKAANGQRVIEIVNWSKHQKVDHPNEKAALPQVVEEEPLPEFRESLANNSEVFAKDSRALAPDLDLNRDLNRDHDLKPSPPTRKKLRVVEPPQPTWVQMLYSVWIDKVGAVSHPQLGKALKPLVDKYDTEAVIAAIDVYGSADEGPKGARSVTYFAQNFKHWLRIAQTPLVDPVTGEQTMRGKRVGVA